eukprot:TRINITY_DN5813_c0_g1_i1.p1 TRINITY_DN5813_c0_g1~~TRINITY_DN5813_c0_g1_i1.p1  ORF type:complete len:315 (+),score=70.47 TRINITY_DN5813_c0_g1_i1:128-1072(+)
MLLYISIAVVIFAIFFILKKAFPPKSELWVTKDENHFVDPNLSNAVKSFPSLFSPPSVELSVIVPSYNEEERLPIMLRECIEYLEKRTSKDPSFSYEVIIVDDGSRDKTTPEALQFSKKYTTDRVRVLTLQKNRGKGGAVRRGMMCARGKYLLFADADGATKFPDVERLEKGLKSVEKNGLGIGAGSRAHLQQEAVAKRHPFRNFLMYGFHILLSILGVRGIKDTQCGFKMFTRRTAQLLFPNLNIERWAFDVELFVVAAHFDVPTSEIAVNWTEVPGSKLTPLAASIQMFRDLLRIRTGYMLRFWTVDRNPQE